MGGPQKWHCFKYDTDTYSHNCDDCECIMYKCTNPGSSSLEKIDKFMHIFNTIFKSNLFVLFYV